MNTKAYIKQSLEQTKGLFLALATDMRDAPTTFPTPTGGNHPLWCLGHVILSEESIIQRYVLGREIARSEWAELFGQVTSGAREPLSDPSVYPSFDELLSRLEEVRAATMDVLDTLSEEDLDKPSHAPQERAVVFGTIGQCLIMVTHHWMFHAGQVADARRAAGLEPLFA